MDTEPAQSISKRGRVGEGRPTLYTPELAATDAHVSICGQITRDELFARLKEVDVYNGLYNRFLWWCVRRSKTLPRGGESDICKITSCLNDLKEVILWARGTGQLHRSQEAEEFWDKTYRELTKELSGVYGAMTSRAEAQILRLSMIYALADKSVEIAPDHLKAALAVWNYARDSVRYLFSKELKDAKMIKAFKAIKSAGARGISRRDLIVDVFQRHITADELAKCLRILEEGGYVVKESRKTAGRPAEIWKSTF